MSWKLNCAETKGGIPTAGSLCCFTCQGKLQDEQSHMKHVIKVNRQRGKSQTETFLALKQSGGRIIRACGREMIDREKGWEDKKTEREQDRLDGREQTSYSSCRQLTESLK